MKLISHDKKVASLELSTAELGDLFGMISALEQEYGNLDKDAILQSKEKVQQISNDLRTICKKVAGL